MEGGIPKDEDLQSEDDEKNISIKPALEKGAEYMSEDPEPAVLFRDCKIDKGVTDNKNTKTILSIVDKFNDFSFFNIGDLKKNIKDRNVLVVYGYSHQTRARPALEAISQN